MNYTLADTISTGLNNPECAFYVGAFAGMGMIIKWLFALWILFLITKAFEKLAWEPLLNWIKTKIYRKKDNLGDDEK